MGPAAASKSDAKRGHEARDQGASHFAIVAPYTRGGGPYEGHAPRIEKIYSQCGADLYGPPFHG